MSTFAPVPVAAQAPSLALGLAPVACGTDSDSAIARRVAAYLDPLARAGELSATVLIARGDCIVVERVFGFARLKPRTPNTPNTRFAVASITKPLTNLVLNRLVREGRLALSDPLARWLPAFPHGSEITVAQLRDHRAGIAHRVTAPTDEYRPYTAADIVTLAARHQLLSAPGTKTAYSTAGYSVLARVLELASGHPYAVLLDSLVFRPADARDAVDATAGHPMPPPARSYLRVPGGIFSTRPRDLSYLVGGGSVYATARDLFRIVRTLVGGGYGPAARDSALRNGRLDWTGITDGYIAFAGYDSATSTTAVVTANVFTGAIVRLHEDLPRLAAGIEVAPPKVPTVRPVPLSSALRRRLAGPYGMGPGEATVLEFLTPSLATFGGATLVATSDTPLCQYE